MAAHSSSNGSRVLYVTGKGGVGKTSIASALCASAHEAGESVVLVTFAESLAPDPRWPTIEIDTELALEQLVHRLLRMRFISRRVLGSRTFNAVSDAAPGVRDLVYMAYLADLADGRTDNGSFDRIIVDGFASGHTRVLLTAVSSVHDLVRMGPIGMATDRAEALLADGDRFRALIAALPEELPVIEALDLWDELSNEGITLMDPVANGVFPERLSAEQRAWVLSHDASADSRLYESIRDNQTAACARLAAGTGRPLRTLDFTFDGDAVTSADAAALLFGWR
jgi:anion-transporting  ArsA/GET3 family ATPase